VSNWQNNFVSNCQNIYFVSKTFEAFVFSDQHIFRTLDWRVKRHSRYDDILADGRIRWVSCSNRSHINSQQVCAKCLLW